LKCADGRNQNVKHKRSRTNDRGSYPEQRHRRDVTRCAGVTDGGIKKRYQADREEKKNEMRGVHEMTNDELPMTNQ
jgi:hypothetical protein